MLGVFCWTNQIEVLTWPVLFSPGQDTAEKQSKYFFCSLMIFKHRETCRFWFIRRKEFQFRPKYPCQITNKKYPPLQFCRYNSVPLLHQPSWSQKDDFGQKWVHQSDSPPEERCGSRYEHGQQRALLVRHLPKEDLQVSVDEIRMNLAFLFLILRMDASSSFSIQSSNGLGWRLQSSHHSRW